MSVGDKQPPKPKPSNPPSSVDDDVLNLLNEGADDDDMDIPTPAAGFKPAAVRPSGPAKPGGPAPSFKVVTESAILNELSATDDDEELAPAKPKEYKPGGTAKVAGIPLDPKARAEYEARQAKIAALAQSVNPTGATPKDKVADRGSPVAVVFVFKSVRDAEAAYARLSEDVRKAMKKSVKDVAGNGQLSIGSMLTPRKLLQVIRELKDAGGVYRNHKSESPSVQQWLDEHLKS